MEIFTEILKKYERVEKKAASDGVKYCLKVQQCRGKSQ